MISNDSVNHFDMYGLFSSGGNSGGSSPGSSSTADEVAEMLKDDANEKCCASKMGEITIYVDLYNEKVGSLESQIKKLYGDETGNKLAPNAGMIDNLKYIYNAFTWAQENETMIANLYGEEDGILPGHVFVGYKGHDMSQASRWHFSSGADVFGKSKGTISNSGSSHTHYRKYTACPKTIEKIKKHLDQTKNNVPYYHIFAGQLKTLNGNKLSNCIEYALEAVESSGISTSDISPKLEPWDLVKNNTSFKAK